MYKEAAANGMLLNAYDTSADTAIAVLEADGWIYDANGEPYVEGVRYKKIPAEYADENDKTYKSIDGAYVTTKVGDDYYMPLVLNWYGTTDNPFSDLLVTDFEQGANIAAAGIVIQKTTGDFNPMLDEFYQQAVYGFYSGTPMYSCFDHNHTAPVIEPIQVPVLPQTDEAHVCTERRTCRQMIGRAPGVFL